MMKHYSEEWIQEWCAEHGWTDLYIEGPHYWAFPPGAVIPEPIPPRVMQWIKNQKGLSIAEKRLLTVAALVTGGALLLSYLWHSPMPIVFAFAFGAITAGLLEVEDS